MNYIYKLVYMYCSSAEKPSFLFNILWRWPIPKSDVVQHQYREILVDPDVMSNFQNIIAHNPIDHKKKDELLELNEKLIEIIKDLISTKLTNRQSEVVQKIYFEQRTQMEVADSLGLCQTTINV